MTGLFLIAVLAIWIVVLRGFVRKLVAFLPERPWRKFVQLGMFVVLMPLPLVDEIVGGWQFAQLCKQHDTIQVDREKIRGATIYYVPTSSTEIENLWLPVRHQAWQHIYKTTGAMAMKYDSFHATGGWLIRTLRISESNVPLLFHDSCFPHENPVVLMKFLNVTTLDRPTENLQGK
jgi:hypothetical protein